MSEHRLLELTSEIYDAATGATGWGTVGRGLIRLVEAETASLMAGNFAAGEAELLYHGDFPMDAVLAYRDHYRSVDLWTNRAAEVMTRSRRTSVWTSGTLVPDPEFLHSEFYADFGRPLGLRYVVGTVIPLGPAGVMPIGLHRPADARPFERTHALMLQELVPHLRRAMQLRHQLCPATTRVTTSLAALDALAAGVLVVDADLHVLLSNTAAEAIAAADGPIRFERSSSGHVHRATVRAQNKKDGEALNALVRATALVGAAGGAVPLHDAEGTTVAAALVTPLPNRFALATTGASGIVPGHALILLRDIRPAAARLRPELLRELFGLTAAEAAVALALVGGATNEEVAAQRNARVSTVRTQVRAILAKTGTNGLRGLERMLATLTGT